MPTFVDVSCSYCGKSYKRTLREFNSRNKLGGKMYCSQECQSKGQCSGGYVPCAYCGKVVYKTISKLMSSKSRDTFCSRSCSASAHNKLRFGESHPNFTTGAGSYRTRALKVGHSKCSTCGWDEDPRVLEVHHIDENRKNNSIENLIILCPNCGCFVRYHITGGGSYYTCSCGFDTRDIVITYSNTTQDSKPSRIVYGVDCRVVEILDDEQRSKILRKIT